MEADDGYIGNSFAVWTQISAPKYAFFYIYFLGCSIDARYAWVLLKPAVWSAQLLTGCESAVY